MKHKSRYMNANPSSFGTVRWALTEIDAIAMSGQGRVAPSAAMVQESFIAGLARYGLFVWPVDNRKVPLFNGCRSFYTVEENARHDYPIHSRVL
jgi:hypothetical protein